MKKLKMFFVALTLLASALASAQNIKIKGVVSDANTGEGIPFAAIQVKGTMTGASADTNGEYSISAPANGTLIFSSIGYTTTEIAVNGQAVVNAALAPDATALEETIVVAYGTSTKNAFTGSASVVNSEAIEAHVASSVTGALAGTTPGVQILSSTGDPASGGSATIRIRGIGSMSASNNPLIILDGMPYEGSMSDINPNDVESMSVLKDAAASAIYGARGANGVVLITTKKAKTGEATIKLDAKWGSNSRLIPQYDVITDPGQYYETHYRQMYNSKIYAGASQTEAYAYANANLFDKNNGGLGYDVYTYPEGENLIGTNFKLNPNAKLGKIANGYYYQPDDWYNEVFHSSLRQEYTLSVSGSGERFNYYSSFGYLDDGGLVDNSEYKRYTGRINADYQAKKWLKITSSMSFSHTDAQSPATSSSWGSSGNMFYICNMLAPIYPLYVRKPVYNDAGEFIGAEIQYENGIPVYDANQTGYARASIQGNAVRDNAYDKKQNYADVVTAKGGIILTPVTGLSLTANVGIFSDNTRFNQLVSSFASASSVDGIAYVSHSRTFAVNTQYLAEYKTDFGGSLHNIDVLAGFEQYKYKGQALSGENDHLFNPYIGELNNADGTDNKDLSSNSSSYLTMGFLSRAQYDYDGKYFASASFRRDASSRFARGHRWGNFGSIGLAWLASKEDFMSGIDWIDLLKLKASWGVQGNDNLNSLYPYADQYEHSYKDGQYSSKLAAKGNDNLTWETSHAINAGVDFELFHGKLNGTIEGFTRITTDLLYSKDVPLSSGNPLGYMPVNVGSISNTGFEVTLDGNIINTQKVKWNWNLNFSHYTNKILSLDESVSEEGIKGSNYIYRVGGSLYQAYVRKFAGLSDTGKAMWYYNEKDEDGNLILDEKGNTIVKTTDVFSKADQYDIGTVLPWLYGGFGTSLNAFGFDFSIQCSFQLGGMYYDGTYQALMHTSSGTGLAWHKDALKAWSYDNQKTDIPRLDGDVSVGQTTVDNYFVSSDYLSINNITLGYTLPKSLLNKLPIESLRVYVAGENLGVLTARKGIDPRFSLGLGGMTSGSGLNSNSYSAMRNLTAGITLTF